MTPYSNLASIIERPSRLAPDRAALILDDREITFATLAARRDQWAGRLLGDLGVRVGQQVLVVALANEESVAAMLAAAQIGAAAALINPALAPGEIAQLNQGLGGAAAAIVGAGLGPPLHVALPGCSVTELGAITLSVPPQTAITEVSEADEALVLFTSGTTGLPKPVPITHRAIFGRIGQYAASFDPEVAPSVRLMCAPMFHIGGLLGLLISLTAGNTTVLQPHFDAGEWLRLVERHAVTSTFVVPTMLHRILEHPDFAQRDLSSLTQVAYGAAAAPIELIHRAMAALPQAGFINTFGQTETLGGYTALTPEDHRNPDRIGSVGRPAPGIELRIVEPGTDIDVAPGAAGELMVRGEQTLSEGWMRTGDLARLDDEGYLYPVGRISDTINRGGEKFGPAEIEDVLRKIPGVQEVGVCAIADRELGERVAAGIVMEPGVPAPTVEEIRTFCRQHLARFKVPDRIEFYAALPYTDVGKLSRVRLAQLLSD